MKKIIILLSVGLVVTALAAPIQAAQVNFSFSGEITSVVNPDLYLDSIGITESSTFTGSFTYDTDEIPVQEVSPNFVIYNMDLLTITIDQSIVFSNYPDSLNNTSSAYVFNDEPRIYGGDEFGTGTSLVQSSDPGLNNLFSSWTQESALGVQLKNYQGDVWDDTSLPASFDIADFDEATINIYSLFL